VKLSFRNQLSLWIMLTILLIVFAIVFITEQTTVWSLRNTLDENLKKRAYMVASVISSDITTDEESYINVISDLANQELSFISSQLRVVNPEGKLIVQFGEITNLTSQQLDTYLGLSDVSTGHFSTLMTEKKYPLRSFTILVFHPKTLSSLAYVQIVESLGYIEESKTNLWRNGLILGLFGSFIAIIIGQILIRRGFKPLYAIIGAIDQVDYSHLKSSIREQGPTELEQLSKSLSAMWLRLDMAVSEKRQVIGNMSHDSRTPLTALHGQLEVLLTQPSLTPKNKDSVIRMLDETRRLTRMVKNMLLSVQLESQSDLATEEVNLKEIVDQVVGDMWALTKGLEFNIAANEDVIISGNRDLLVQGLINIIDNSIKFTPKGGKIELDLTTESDWAVLSVADTGRGIPEKQLPHVMEPFYKAGLARKPAGEGARLGLSIVKQIVDLHHGQIKIQSREGLGTTITLRLPVLVRGNLPVRSYQSSLIN
jgi:signal transduction histidine kinase